MQQPAWQAATVDDRIEAIATGERLDYRSGPYHDSEGDGRLPPAWDVDVESYAVGYEPVGATSIGTATERHTHTKFSYLRTPADRLAKLNEGRHPSDGTLGARLARLDKKRITQAYSSKLELSQFVGDEAVRAMLLLNLDAFGQHKRIEKVALTVIRIVVNDNRFGHHEWRSADRISESSRFKDLADEVGLDTRTMTRLSKRIKDQLKPVGFFDRETERLELKQAEMYHHFQRDLRPTGQAWPPHNVSKRSDSVENNSP